jgi:hypothetical protein
MIRNLVLALLAFNLLYLVWAQWIDRGDPPVASRPLPPNPGTAPATASPCASVGPFSEPMPALQAKEKLQASGLVVENRVTSETRHDGWLVHVDHADQEQQSRTLEALRRASFRDVFAMPDHPRFRVSVGVFSAEAQAEDRAAQVQRLRLDAAVSEWLREQAVIWLDVRGIAREALRDGRLAAAGVELAGLRIESCPTGAAAPPAGADADIIPAP